MANRKLSASDSMSVPSSGSLLMIVDVLDTTDGLGGTNKKITWTNIASALSVTDGLYSSASISSPASGDLMLLVDISDTTEGVNGTKKKISWSDVLTFAGAGISGVPYTGAINNLDLGFNNITSSGIGRFAQFYSGEYTQAGTGATSTKTFDFDWNNGKDQVAQLVNGANNVFTFNNPVAVGHYMIILKQPATGITGSITYPSGLRWSNAVAGTTSGSGSVDVLFLVYSNALTGYFASLVNNVRAPS